MNPELSREHRQASEEIRPVFDVQATNMNGRHLRAVLSAYLAARDLQGLPFRVRSRAVHRHGLQSFYLCVEYPDPGETPAYERNYVEIPDGFGDDLRDLVRSWFERNAHRLRVSMTLRQRGWATSHPTGYQGFRVVSDPWFADRC